MTTEMESGDGERGSQVQVSGRDRLRAARDAVEEALLVPAADTTTWHTTMSAAVQSLETAFRRHRDVSEAPDGPLHRAETLRPQLARAARTQRQEHEEILRDVASILATLAGSGVAPADPDSVRWYVGRLQESIRRHIARGSDLLYEAFVRDEGGEG